MKVLRKTKTETIITGVELTGKEFCELFDGELQINLPMEVEAAWDDSVWETGPLWDDWVIEGAVKITFKGDEVDLPRYKAPETPKKKVAPDAAAKTAEISEALLTGRHTTTHSTLYPLPESLRHGWIVASPGMKVFGLAHLAPDAIAHAFVDIRPLLGQCRFRDCRHAREPGCAVQEAVAAGRVAAHRLALLRSLIAESKAARAPGR